MPFIGSKKFYSFSDALHFLTIALGVFCVLTFREVNAASPRVDFLPHRAVYNLGLKSSHQGAISSMGGQIIYDWSSDCKGWVVKNELDMNIAYSNGLSTQMALRFSAWEAQDGSKYRFVVNQGDSANGLSNFIGKAVRDNTKDMVTVDISVPEPKRAELNEVLFPTAFLAKIIEAAQNGIMTIKYPVFDGTTELEAFNVSAVILPAEIKSKFSEMQGLSAWRVFLAYYEQSGESTLPLQEQSLLLYENGVVTDVQLDFGSFTVAGNLIEFEATNLPVCD